MSSCEKVALLALNQADLAEMVLFLSISYHLKTRQTKASSFANEVKIGQISLRSYLTNQVTGLGEYLRITGNLEPRAPTPTPTLGTKYVMWGSIDFYTHRLPVRKTPDSASTGYSERLRVFALTQSSKDSTVLALASDLSIHCILP